MLITFIFKKEGNDMRNLNENWMKESIQKDIFIRLLEETKRDIIGCSDAYMKIFNGSPFYESWTIESAKDVIVECIVNGAIILVPEVREKIVGFLFAMNGVPEEKKPYVPLDDESVMFIDDIGIVKDWRNNQIASELVRNLLNGYLGYDQNYLAYRTNAMRYFEQNGGESFEAGTIRVQKEDVLKRQTGEKISIPEFSMSEKQTFINRYLELIKYRPDLDVSNSNQLFRNIFGNIDFCQIGENYTFQLDPTGEGNDRIFPIIDLDKKLTLTKGGK